ncbi:MAG: hypothetical protein ACLRIO_02820, partial [Butyricicoccus sp.]
ATVNLVNNGTSAINSDGTVYIGKGTTIMNNGSTALYGGGIQNRGNITIAPDAKVYNNHAKMAGDDIYNTSGTSDDGLTTYTGKITFAPVGDGWILDDCKEEHPIVGWYHDGKENRWNGDGEGDAYYADEYTVSEEAVSDALALKAAHGQLCSVTYEVTGDIPSDAGAVPAAAKVKKGGSYTVAPGTDHLAEPLHVQRLADQRRWRCCNRDQGHSAGCQADRRMDPQIVRRWRRQQQTDR